MNKATKCLLLGIAATLVVLYALAWFDLIGSNRLIGNTFEDVQTSFTYYISWLPYWWLVILIASIMIALILCGVRKAIKILRS